MKLKNEILKYLPQFPMAKLSPIVCKFEFPWSGIKSWQPVIKPVSTFLAQRQEPRGADNLPEPEILADDILDNSEASLANFRALAASLSSKRSV